ncbi:MAG: N-6 DNA methylase [Candidatus Heimdallarchaeota archaeon]|nr:MAG: N-6 DNA methylase [Candidatus Heimdallarchaeota archaeon]
MDSQTRHRKNLGAFYTPTHLAKSLTQAALKQFLIAQINSQTNSKFSSLEDILNTSDLLILEKLRSTLENIRILDGSAGDGEFLKACLIAIIPLKDKINDLLSLEKENPEEAFFNIIQHNLFGMEIDSETTSKCHKTLGTVIPNLNLAFVNTILHDNIITGDFLESSHSDWIKLPPTSKGFDIILGNPPWGGKLTKTQRDHYQRKYKLKSPKRNLNTFSLFVYQATRLLNPDNGILAYLLPKNVTRSNQYTNLREFLVKNFKILSINFHGLFQDVTQEFITIIGLHNNEIPPEHFVVIDGKTHVPQTSYLTNIDYIFSKDFDPQSTKLIQLINKNSTALDHFLTIRRGEELSKRGGIMFCPNCTEWVPLSSRKPSIICSICKQPLSQGDLKTKFLISNEPTSHHTQPILTGDDFEAFLIPATHFINPTFKFRSKKNPSIYTSPKIVIQKIKPYLCAAYESNSYWTTQNVYNLTLKPEYSDSPDLLFFFLSVLNSSLYQWFYETQFNLGSRYTNAISIHNLKRLPLKNPDFSDPLYHQIVQLAKKISKGQSTEEDSILQLNKLILRYYEISETLPFSDLQ